MMRRTIDPAGWWSLTPGPANAITDVEGVRVGQRTLLDHGARTGVTAILPHEDDLYRDPVPAAVEVHNGFGKSVGLIQLRELGQIESPILLTNTFGVSACAMALIRRAVAANPAIGRSVATVNPLVLECNDGGVNDIQALHVTEQTANEALAAVSNRVAQGTVGAGAGMRTFGYAGGIGTASRTVGSHTLGVLVLANFGTMSELRVMGRRVPPVQPRDKADKGSVIMVVATDAPLDARQLGRLCRRAPAALGRLGSYMGHGSGDITVAFSTVKGHPLLPDAQLDGYFLATVETIEEAILNAIWHGAAREGYDGSLLPEFRRHFESLS